MAATKTAKTPKVANPAPKESKPKTPPKWGTTIKRNMPPCWDAGVWVSFGLSVGLNAYAAYVKSQSMIGGLIGATLPITILLLSKVSAGQYLDGMKVLSGMSASVCVFMLALSITHCRDAFKMVGFDYAVAQAISVDLAMIVFEVESVRKHRKATK